MNLLNKLKEYLKFFLLWLISMLCYGEQSFMLLPIDSIYDGDTIKTHISTSRLPAPLNELEVRVLHIDTPEMPAPSYATTGKLGKAKCKIEAENAIAARNAVIKLMGSTVTMKVTNYKWDKYGGRILGDVKINNTDVATFLMTTGYGVMYEGEAKSTNWCAP